MVDEKRARSKQNTDLILKAWFSGRWGGGEVTELFFADLCQRSAHRLNFQQREETPVWQRAKSLNK